MTYERHRLGRQKVRYDDLNTDTPLEHQFAIDDAKVAIDGSGGDTALITIYAPGGTTALVDAAAMEVSGSLLRYSVDTTDESTWLLQKGYRADIVVNYADGDRTPYKRHEVFDLARYVFMAHLTFDQLVAADHRVRGMTWDGDEDFSELIGACRDELQARVEAKMVDAERLKLEMMIDSSMVASAFRPFVLSRIYRAANDHDQANEYREVYRELLASALSTMPLDKTEDGSEGEDEGAILDTRFEL